VKRSELKAVELAGILLLELAEDLLETVELADKDVCLVNLISHND
jgi:hypothetical protein